MQRLNDTNQKWLLAHQVGPCVSIYVDLLDANDGAKGYPELLGEAERLIEKNYGKDLSASFMRPLAEFQGSLPRLEGLEGVAVFRSRTTSGYIPLYSRPKSEVIVAENFHLEPILSLLQEGRKYLVLALGSNKTVFFLATETSLEKLETFTVDPEELPAGSEPEWTHPWVGYWKFKLPAEEKVTRPEQFLRLIQQKITPGTEHSTHPLIVIGPAHLIESYRNINTYPGTIELDIPIDADAMDELTLHDQIEALLRDRISEEGFGLIDEYIDRYELGQATDSIPRIATLAVQGKIRTLLVERDRKLWGILDRGTGNLETNPTQRDARDSDVLDDISHIVISQGGDVVLMDTHYMPTRSPLAAILKETRHLRAA